MFSGRRYANVTATIALIVALGGTSYAAIKLLANSVGSKQIKRSAVTSGKVKNGSPTLALPPGSYLVYGTAYGVVSGSNTFTCTLSAGGASQAASEFGTSSIALSVGVTSSAAATASLTCTGALGYSGNIAAVRIETLG